MVRQWQQVAFWQVDYPKNCRIAVLMEAAGLPSLPPKFLFEKWISHMSHDKKVSSGVMRFIGLNRLGEANITEVSDIDILKRTLQPYL